MVEDLTMKGNARNKLRVKARKLQRLYSLWHETHQPEVQKKYLAVLGEILSIEPNFSLRREFQNAF